jgi:hypothetical protein
VKIKIRPEHADMLQMNDWLAELQDGESAEPAGPGPAEPTGPGYAVPAGYSHAVPASPGYAVPAGYVRAVPASPRYAVPAGHGCAEPAAGSARPEAPVATAASARIATPAVPAGPAAPAAPGGPAGAAERAVIGDQLRMPIMWCEMGSCISWHADPAALGEADTRARAIGAGWRIDALGRLACPRCQQTDPGYWAAGRVVPWDRSMAIARTARFPAVPGYGAAGRAAVRGSGDPGRAASGYPPPSRAELEWHHDFPADQAMPAGRYAGDPAGTSRSRGLVFNAVRAWRARGGRPAAPGQGSEPGEDMIAERAHAGPAGAMTLTGR